MVPKELPIYPTIQIEKRASNLLRARTGSSPYHPIDVEAILESMPDVVLDVYPDLRRSYSVEGCVCKDLASGKLFVFIDARIADTEDHYRMVIAEELGHIALHREVIEAITNVDDFYAIQQHKDWTRVEKDARDFGRAILMPLSLVIKEAEIAYEHLVDVAGFGDVNAIEKYLRNLLAEAFAVRPDDMHRRLIRSPSDVYQRVQLSVSLRSDKLLSLEHRARAIADSRQKRLWQDEPVKKARRTD